MNNTTTLYKTLTVLLLIVSIVLAVLLYQEKNQSATDSIGDPTTAVEECSTLVAEWRATNGTVLGNASVEARAELEEILNDCRTSLE